MFQHTTYYLGVDGGASKTDLLLVDQLGKKVAQTQTGPTNLAAVGEKTAAQQLQQGLKQLQAEIVGKHQESISPEQVLIEFAVLGLAGVNTEQDEEAAAHFFQPILSESEFDVEQFAVLNDTVIALVNATEREQALVLVAGTGSNCYGENAQGEVATAGSLGHLLADQGSAYDIGLKVLRAGAKSFDGRGPQTVLEAKLCHHFQVERFDHLVDKVYQPDLNKTQIAALAELWQEALEAEDQVAAAILQWEVQELWLMVKAVAQSLDLAQTGFDLVLQGSFAQFPPVVKALKKRAQQFAAEQDAQDLIDIVLPHRPAVWGAVKLARGRDIMEI
jgi:N-acetylglucosamine kinase-like BadF-type ATPase